MVVLITGSTDGLGREVALELAEPGVHIAVHGRNRERGLEVVRAIEEAGGTASFYQADLADLAQVRTLGEEVLRDFDRLDVLVNNAGIWLTPEQGRRVSAEGHELHFAVNYLSHYLLTRTLLPLLLETPSARIVNVASGAQQPIDFDDVMLERNYSDGRGYAQSKLAQILFTIDLAEELEGTGVTVNALHPASMMNTTMVLSRGAATRSSVEEGVEAVVHLVRSTDVGSGGYYNGTRPARANAQAYDAAARARLRRLSEELTARLPTDSGA
ncbi:MAG TPA: SDR family NAD(P)-dependent oxidoreductase [Longimicrobiaceae bacterium]|nr:SDR family NAD(P)-dependent oxidoreductase [Longimicrobiaceae bacterium]